MPPACLSPLIRRDILRRIVPLRLDPRILPTSVTLGLDPQSAFRPAVGTSVIVILIGTPDRLCQLGIQDFCAADLFLSLYPFHALDPRAEREDDMLLLSP